jgi:uroporphyrinogen decarboxylase
MMSHRDRLHACLRGQETDRVPVALWRHFPVDDQVPESLASAHLAFQKLYDFDIVKVTPASSFAVRDWGVEDSWQGNPEGTRTYTRRVIHDPRDWKRLPALKPDSTHLAAQLECLRQIRARLGSETPILQTIFNPLVQAKHLAGEPTLAAHLRAHPEAVAAGLQIIARTTHEFIRAAIETGIDGIFYAVQHAQASFMSPAEFTSFSRELDLGLLNSAGELWCNVLHVHGNDIYFDTVSDYPAALINWHDQETSPSLAEAGQTWRGALCGGLSRASLALGTPTDISAEASDALTATQGRSLMLSTGCVVPIIAPHGNLMAARHAVDHQPESGGLLQA